MSPTACHPKKFPRRQRHGFTLIEVLIALLIVSVALAAFVRITSQSTVNLAHLEQRTLAMLSAENSMAEMRIGKLPSPGVQIFGCPQADQDFICRVNTSAPQNGLRTVTVDVFPDRTGGQNLAHLQSQQPERTQ